MAALKKLTGGDVAGRFSAWWDGRDYVPGDDSGDNDDEPKAAAPKKKSPDKAKKKPEKKSEKKTAGKAATKVETKVEKQVAKPVAVSGVSQLSAAASRIAALETLWGEGRFSPGSSELYARLTDGMKSSGGEALFGIINGDPALTQQIMAASGARPVVADWRSPCLSRFRESFPRFDVLYGDLDRPIFQTGSLSLVVSTDAFVYSDHKAGLALRIMRSLAPGGQWIVLDTVRVKATGNIAPAYASAWGEPQLIEEEDIREICETAGFRFSGHSDDVSGDVIQASRKAFERFGEGALDIMGDRLKSVDKTAYMQELAWEAETWKWRQRALAGDFIHMKVWKFRKPAN